MESLYPDVEEVAKLTEEEVGEIVERYKAKYHLDTVLEVRGFLKRLIEA